jgi:hypothetical protein
VKISHEIKWTAIQNKKFFEKRIAQNSLIYKVIEFYNEFRQKCLAILNEKIKRSANTISSVSVPTTIWANLCRKQTTRLQQLGRES